ncbi:MAG: sugar transferase [Mogibacterium sp.]|nr:sugar transferase [Mogibacterium sp.]
MERKNYNTGKREIVVRLVKLADPVVITLLFVFVWDRFFAEGAAQSVREEVLIVGLLYFIIYVYLTRLYRGYWIHISRMSELIYAQFLSAILTLIPMYVVTLLLQGHLPKVWPMLLLLAVQFFAIVLWVELSQRWYFAFHKKRRAIILRTEEDGSCSQLRKQLRNKHLELAGVFTAEECVDKNFEPLSGAEIVFVCDIRGSERERILKACVERKKTVYLAPGINDALMYGAEGADIMQQPLLYMSFGPKMLEYRMIKRLADVILSAAGLIVLSPLMLVVAAAIRLEDHGPAFYRQERLTYQGRTFQILKFRSMTQDAEKDGRAELSSGESDSRVTRIGRFLRRCRIDELPQLINVLKGEMSLVGPRPERPEIAEIYTREIPEFPLRLRMRAGITGYAQVHGRYNTSPRDKLVMDLLYITRAGFQMDFHILLATARILFLPESTEGFTKEEVRDLGLESGPEKEAEQDD